MTSDAVKRAEAEDDREFEGLFARHRIAPTLLATILLLVLGTFVIGRLSPTPRPADFDEPDGWSDVEQALAAAVADPAERVVLLLGDSVLRPGILREAGFADSETLTPAAWARRLSRSPAVVYDLSLDGLLPADMLSIVTRLDELDASGRVELAIELSPRYFASDYAIAGNAHARPFLARRSADSEIARIEEEFRLLRHRFGMKEARRRLVPMIRSPERELLEGPRTATTAVDRLRAGGRFMNLTDDGLQHAALAALVDRVAARDRRSLFFCTPVNEQALGGPAVLPTLDDAIASFRAIVRDRVSVRERARWRHVFRNFDDEAFTAGDFLDHVHLRPEANARLALRVMRALALPSIAAARPPEGMQRFGQGGIDAGAELEAALGGVFLDADRVIAVGADHRSVLIDLDCGTKTALGFELPNDLVSPEKYRLIFWRAAEDGDGLALMSFELGRDLAPRVLPAPEGGWPFAEPPLFDARDSSMIANSAGRLHLFDWREPRLLGSVDLPAALADRAPVLGEDRLFLVAAGRDPEGRPRNRKQIHALSFEDLRAGRTDQVSLVAQTGSRATEEAFALRFLESFGLRQKPGLAADLPLASFGRAWFWDRTLTLEGPAPQDPRQSCLWMLSIDTGVIQVLVAPAGDGFVVRPNDRGRILADRHLAFHAASGRALIVRAGRLEVRETRFDHRVDWLYGAPPNMESDIVVANGPTRRRRDPGCWRVGLFGSSLLGASFPDERPDPKRLMGSLSLTSALDAELDSRLGDSPHRAQALDYSQAQSDIVRSYAALLRIDPREIHVALIGIDAGSLGNPDDARDPTMPRASARFAALERDAQGLPELDFQAGFRPRVRLREIRPEDLLEPEEKISRCIGEMIALCRAREIRPVFVDLAAAEEDVAIDPELDFIRAAVRAHGAELIDLRRLIAADKRSLPAVAYGGDRHFRPAAIRLLARVLADVLERTMDDDLFSLAARDRAKNEASAAMPRFAGLMPRRAVIDAARARHYDVSFQRSAIETRPEGPRLVYDLGREEPETDFWRQALALLGLQGAPGLGKEGEVLIELVRFADYDEYGRGRGTRPEVVARFRVAGRDIERAFSELDAALDAPQAPSWLGRP